MFNWKKRHQTNTHTKYLHYCQKYDENCVLMQIVAENLRWWTGRWVYWESTVVVGVFLFISLGVFSVCCWLSLSIECEKTAAKWISSVKHSMRCVYSWWAFGVCSCFSRRKMGDYSRNREQRENDCLSTHVKGFFLIIFPYFLDAITKKRMQWTLKPMRAHLHSFFPMSLSSLTRSCFFST